VLPINASASIFINSSVMKRKTRSILEEINSMSPRRDKKQIVEANAEQVIMTAINLIELINETFDAETAADLNKRLINSIKTKDLRKFKRGITRVEDQGHNRWDV
jgi:hypothetical protein